ncbi:hypothetical protein OOT46_08985 [Aquabacterium sp. A7-Y]|uniref:hypothetical protein n=1 Tax=Aquabacterium sp. A7-Y TaxID=1349605 RepID=UPI00223DC6C6|nr:hypothetical protein [Aquabacterium sp. A7-Y]MCW7537982.1 hypothetical protein [Aquabacterium sp. A7-Y]
MSSIVIVSPVDIPDSELLFDEEETQQILRFFWPDLRSRIDGMEVTHSVRRFAQQILIAGIDSSYALGFMQTLMETFARPQAGFKGLLKMGKKLAQRYMKHWWKHAKQSDLENPRVAEAVRRAIAYNFRQSIDMVINEVNARPILAPFQVAGTFTVFWGSA